MKMLAMLTIMFSTLVSFAHEEKMPLGEKISTVARSLRYLLSPTFNTPKRQEKITQTQRYQNWKIDLKHFSDVIYHSNYEDETQFEHAIQFLSIKLQNDQQPLAGYFPKRSEFRTTLRAEKEMTQVIFEDPNLQSAYTQYYADEAQPRNTAQAAVWAKDINYSSNAKNFVDQYQSLQDFITRGQTSESCQSACPKNSLILRMNRSALDIDYRKSQTHESFTTFRNLPQDFDQYIKKQFGFCWGHTSILYKFKRYAHFSPNKMLDDVEMIKQKIIDVVRHEKIVEFNGYSSLLELTQSEELKKFTMAEIAREWARNAMTISNIIGLKGAIKLMRYENYINFYNEIVLRILTNQFVQIKFNVAGVKGWSHIVNAYGFEETKDSYRIYVQDPNEFPKDMVLSGQNPHGDGYFELKKTKAAKNRGHMVYFPLKRIEKLNGNIRVGQIVLTDEGKIQTMQTIDRYQQLCQKVTGCK